MSGKDVFIFDIVGFGSSVTPRVAPTVDGEDYIKSACIGPGSADSDGCGAWVIISENMDYLHCDDLSWNVKTKCD